MIAICERGGVGEEKGWRRDRTKKVYIIQGSMELWVDHQRAGTQRLPCCTRKWVEAKSVPG